MSPPDDDDIDRDVHVSSQRSAASGWTFGTMHLFFVEKIQAVDRLIDLEIHKMDRRIEVQFHEIDRRISDQLHAQSVAIEKAEKATGDRFQSVNEFRNALSDLSNRMITRAESDTRLTGVLEKINDITARLDRNEGKGIGMATIWGIIIGTAGVIGIMATIIMNTLRSVGH